MTYFNITVYDLFVMEVIYGIHNLQMNTAKKEGARPKPIYTHTYKHTEMVLTCMIQSTNVPTKMCMLLSHKKKLTCENIWNARGSSTAGS